MMRFTLPGPACALVLLCASALFRAPAMADEPGHIPGLRVAQFDADDTYDPFADFSEFDEAQDEEADINFFRNGRFVTLGFTGGLRGFTGELSNMYATSPAFGGFLSYFFDLRFATQFSFGTSSHAFSIPSSKTSQVARGTVAIQVFSLDFKYYVNTQNVTKGLGKFNPYVIGGFSRVDRTTQLSGVRGFGKEGAMGYQIGGGIELPILHNKMFVGAQVEYNLINFANENTEIVFADGQKTGRYPNGDSYTALVILGVNF